MQYLFHTIRFDILQLIRSFSARGKSDSASIDSPLPEVLHFEESAAMKPLPSIPIVSTSIKSPLDENPHCFDDMIELSKEE
jgi:hypothetical protein